MLEIKTMADIERLESENVITMAFSDYLKAYFEELRTGLDKVKPVQLFSLEEHGYIIILEQLEDCRSLSQLGIEEVADMLELTPEFVNLIDVTGTKTYYQIGILCSNDFMLILYVPKGFDADVDTYFGEYIV